MLRPLSGAGFEACQDRRDISRATGAKTLAAGLGLGLVFQQAGLTGE